MSKEQKQHTLALYHIDVSGSTPYNLGRVIDHTVAKIDAKLRAELREGRALDFISIHITTETDEEITKWIDSNDKQ